MDRIHNKLISEIGQFDMLRPGDRVTAALSGGADSVALLLLLLDVRERYDLSVFAAHLNHGIRGEAAARDEQFVRELCERLEVPLTVGHADVPAASRTSGESIELAARNMRYDFLRDCAADGKIATAHHAGDNTETVLFNLTRGTGLKGLCGIPPVRGNIIRPMLLIERAEILDFLREREQPFVTDETNADPAYSRNRLRLNVIPELQQINSGLYQNIATCCARLREDEDCLTALASDALARADKGGYLDAAALFGLHRAILARVLRTFMNRAAGCVPDSLHTERLMDLLAAGSGRTELPGGFTAELLKGRLYINGGKTTADSCEKIQISLKLCAKNKVHNLLLKNTIDYDKIGDNLMMRTRQNGDKFRPAGRGVTKSLKKLFNEAAVPTAERDDIRLLCDDRGIVWIEGFGAAERCRVDDHTENILVIEYSDNSGGLRNG